MNKPPDWIFLCDGDARSGLGHVGRCLGYAEMLEDSGRTCAFCGVFDSHAARMVESAGFYTYPSPGMDRIKSGKVWLPTPTEGLLVDTYDADANMFTLLRDLLNQQAKLIVLDDFATHTSYDCDVLINFTVGAESLPYPSTKATFHLGPAFFPARRWLRRLRDRWPKRQGLQELRRVLIVPGSRDAASIVSAFLSMLASLNADVELTIVADDEDVRATVDAWRPMFGVVQITQPQPDLRHLLELTDACLCGGGLLKYECLYAGVPTASLSQNVGQAADSERMSALGLIADLGLVSDLHLEEGQEVLEVFLSDANRRSEMINRGVRLMGGQSDASGLIPFLGRSICAHIQENEPCRL
jgi:spore coat polysaccharide biosynthesis predicted glycosyltransferase SpsG